MCRILRPVCIVSTIVMMLLLISYFWGLVDVGAGIVWKLLISYLVLIFGSFVIFFVDDPASFRGGRNR